MQSNARNTLPLHKYRRQKAAASQFTTQRQWHPLQLKHDIIPHIASCLLFICDCTIGPVAQTYYCHTCPPTRKNHTRSDSSHLQLQHFLNMSFISAKEKRKKCVAHKSLTFLVALDSISWSTAMFVGGATITPHQIIVNERKTQYNLPQTPCIWHTTCG